MNIEILTCEQSDATEELEHCFILSSPSSVHPLRRPPRTLETHTHQVKQGRRLHGGTSECIGRGISWLTLTWMSWPGFSGSGSVGANPVPIVPRYASRFYTHTHTHCPRFYTHTLCVTHPECGGDACTDVPIRKWPSWITLVPPAYSVHGCDEYIGAMHLQSAGAKPKKMKAETHFSSQGRYFHFHFQNVESSRSFIHLARSRFDLVCSDLPCFTNSHPSVTISFILLPTCLWQIHSQKVKNG